MTKSIDYSTLDYEGFRETMINILKQKFPNYDTSEQDPGITIIEGLAFCCDILSYYLDRTANESFLSTATQRENVLKKANELDYTPVGSTSAKFKQIFQIVPRNESYVIALGTKVFGNSSSGTKITYEVADNIVLPANATGLEKNDDGTYKYLVPIIEGETVKEDVLGSSDGTPSQTFKCNFSPVVQDSLIVYVNNGQGYEKWTKVKNFVDSDSNAKVYRQYENGNGETVIEFGTGNSGLIPSKITNGILTSYRVGGGSRGNLTANQITGLVDNSADITATFNPEGPYELGTDSESSESIKFNAPASLKTNGGIRATCLTDYEDLALLHGDVLLAKAIEGTNRHSVYIYLVMKNDVSITDDLIKEFVNYYDDKKEIGYDVFICSAIKQTIDITISGGVATGTTKETIQNLVRTILQSYFNLGQIKIGTQLYNSDISQQIESVTGLFNIKISDIPLINNTNVPILGTLNLNEIQ
jgi:hypothetical protein